MLMLSRYGCRQCLLLHHPALLLQVDALFKPLLYFLHIFLQASQDFLGPPAKILAKSLAEGLGGVLHLDPDLCRIGRQVSPVALVDSDN